CVCLTVSTWHITCCSPPGLKEEVVPRWGKILMLLDDDEGREPASRRRGVSAGQGDTMHLIRIGKRVLNLDNLSYCEAQVCQEEISLKVSFIGSANNTPLTLTDEEA